MTSSAPVVTPPPVTTKAPPAKPARRARVPGWVPWAGGIALAVALYLLFAGTSLLPHDEDARAFTLLRDARDWVDANRNSSPIFLFFINYIRLFIDLLVNTLLTTLHAMGWPGLIVAAGALGWALGGPRLGLLSLAGFAAFGVLGVWDMAVDTLALVIAAVLLSLLIGLPLGIWAGRSERVRRFLTPILDVMQIMPTFAYLAPMTLFFLIGAPSATVATMIYSIPPAIRIAALGIRQVSPTAIEASRSIGATTWQTLFKVQLPMARSTILLAVNQTIMMAISMVVITALIDAPGLGEKIISALSRTNTGSLFDGGIAIVIMAIVLDRMTRAHGTGRSGTGHGTARHGGPAAAGAPHAQVSVRTPCAVPSRHTLALLRAKMPQVTTPGHWLISASSAAGSVIDRPRTSRITLPLSVTTPSRHTGSPPSAARRRATWARAIGITSTGSGKRPRVCTSLDSSAMQMKRSAMSATIFSRVSAAPPPLIM